MQNPNVSTQVYLEASLYNSTIAILWCKFFARVCNSIKTFLLQLASSKIPSGTSLGKLAGSTGLTEDHSCLDFIESTAPRKNYNF